MRVAVIASVFLVLGAVAANAEDAKEEASRLLDEGNEAIRTGRPNDALEAFRKAYAAFPSPKIRLNLAEAYRQIGDPGAAVREYERFVDETEEPAGKLAKAAMQRISELSPEVGRIDVRARRGDKIWVDGVLIGEAPIDPIAATAGSRKVQAGQRPLDFEEVVAVSSGQRTLVDATRLEQAARDATPPIGAEPVISSPVLESPTPAIPDVEGTESKPRPEAIVRPEPKPETQAEEDEGIASKWWFWTVVGVAVAGVGVGVVAASSSGSTLEGELGVTKLSEGWTRL
ncbi:MAG: hypothetical protein HYV07_33415 [Deltaproteobacteria bacterium]|nr:hypothetical protein [Deltaproteobacteria bacterium]